MTCFLLFISCLFLLNVEAIDWSKVRKNVQKVGDILENGHESEIGRGILNQLDFHTQTVTQIFNELAQLSFLGAVTFFALFVWFILELRWLRLTLASVKKEKEK